MLLHRIFYSDKNLILEETLNTSKCSCVASHSSHRVSDVMKNSQQSVKTQTVVEQFVGGGKDDEYCHKLLASSN